MGSAKVLRLLLLVVTAGHGHAAAAAGKERNTITHVKGFDGPLPFALETGYVEVDEAHGAELFYYFIQSERSPREDPLILWITGGPGCSALSGLLFEIGPLKFDVAGYTEGFPRLVYFEDSWTRVSNVIFLDAPVGTGFSYAREEEGLDVSLTGTGTHLRVFLQRWIADHPEFASNPLYIGGDSYSGYTVPVAALEIADQPDKGGLNLKGYLVGNAGTDDKYDSGGKIPFMHGMGLISDELYEAAKGSCGGDFVTTPRNAQCANALMAITMATFAVNPVHILEPMCGLALRPPTPISSILSTGTRRRSARLLVQEADRLALPVSARGAGYPAVAPWRPWYANRQVAGFTTEYAHNLTFATVKGGGHTAPEYRPKECLAMLDRWTSADGRL
ncbi:Serine carboxypeptidase-like 6 [Triticum urartu]|uniref:Serine carboxypeptidase-like 6 n=1 Tax=Triticum urartu TaxID=4572 RepID=M7YT54_TRIUA|nr:Serine carboxypeptidase-like 6 [Triticum urartu]